MAENPGDAAGKEGKKVVVSHFDGSLLRDVSFFPYYMLIALEAGGPLRALLLLVLYPLLWAVERFLSDSLAVEINTFIATSGIRLSDVRSAARAVLPKFFLEDLDPAAYRAFLKCPSRCVITSHPKIFVEHFLREHLLVETVLATELETTKSGICTGFVAKSGVLHEGKKAEAVKRFFGNVPPHCGLYVKGCYHQFLAECAETMIVCKSRKGETVPREEYLTPLVFHDGRLVLRPTPFVSLAVLLWIPFGWTLAIMRMVAGLSLPQEFAYPIVSFLGLKLRVRGSPPLLESEEFVKEGAIFVCTHRTLADPTFMTMALRRKVHALTYSVSKISQFLAPMKSSRLTRNREEDRKIINNLLEREDLFICPEGTTCREPFLLRFSPLFAELGDRVVPVAVTVKMSIFEGTTARGNKVFDSFFFSMNPSPLYEVRFLEQISVKEMRESGKSAIEIANGVQRMLADALGYQCTNYNRKDKYRLLVGNDGSV